MRRIVPDEVAKLAAHYGEQCFRYIARLSRWSLHFIAQAEIVYVVGNAAVPRRYERSQFEIRHLCDAAIKKDEGPPQPTSLMKVSIKRYTCVFTYQFGLKNRMSCIGGLCINAHALSNTNCSA